DSARPFDVERDFPRPARVGTRLSLGSGLGQHAAGRSRKPERAIENVQILEDVGVVIGIDDGDRLARAVALHSIAECYLIKSIGMTDLSRVIADRVGVGDSATGTSVRRGEDIAQAACRKKKARFQFFNSQKHRASPGTTPRSTP